MATETVFKYKGDDEFLKNKLFEFNLKLDEFKFKDEIIVQYTIKFADKYIWIDSFLEDDFNYIIAKYDSSFKENKKDKEDFIKKMLSLGFELDNEEENFEQQKPITSIIVGKEAIPYKTYQGKDYTKEEWIEFEEKEYRKYLEKRNKKSSFLADDKAHKQNFSAESGKLKEIQYFVMNSRQDKVPVYQYPSTMVAPFTFLDNGIAVDIIKYEKDGWCEILSKDGKKGFIQSSHVKKNV